MDKTSKTSPAGCLLRARLYSMLGTNPRRRAGLHRSTRAKPPPARRAHAARAGQAPPGRARRSTAAGQAGARRRQKPARRRAPAGQGARRVGRRPTSERAKLQQAAIAQLKAAVAANPQFVDAFHTLAEIHFKRKDNAAAAVAVLKDDLKANPKDAAGGLALDRDPRPGRRTGQSRVDADDSPKPSASQPS